MDAGFESDDSSITDCCEYEAGFLFTALLHYCDTNRSKLGYDIDIVVHSNNSTPWIDSLMLYLHGKGLKPTRMNLSTQTD